MDRPRLANWLTCWWTCVSASWLLQTVSVRVFSYRFRGGFALSFVLGVCRGVELLVVCSLHV